MTIEIDYTPGPDGKLGLRSLEDCARLILEADVNGIDATYNEGDGDVDCGDHYVDAARQLAIQFLQSVRVALQKADVTPVDEERPNERRVEGCVDRKPET